MGRSDLTKASSSRVENIFAFLLLAWLAFAVVPLGSNRPFFWAANGTIAGILGASFALASGGPRPDAARRSRALLVAECLFAATIICLALQLAPLGPDLLRALGVLEPMIAGLPGATISIDPGATVSTLLRFVTYGIAFWIALKICDERRRAEAIIKGVLVLCVAQAFVGVTWLTVLGDLVVLWPKWAYQGYATGTFVNRNSFATDLAFGVAIAATMLIARWAAAAPSRGRRASVRATRWRQASAVALTVPALCILATGLALSGSRMGVAAAAMGTVVAVLLAPARPGAWRLKGAFLLALGAIMAAVLLYAGAALLERLLALEENAQVRRELYAQTLDMIAARPFTGFGGGSFAEGFALFHRLPLSADVTWDAAHNSYLELIAELGLIAGMLPILAIATLATNLLRAAPRSLTACAGFAVVTVAAVHSAADFSLQVQANCLTFIVVLAAGAAQADRELAGQSQRRVVEPSPELSTLSQ